MFQNPSRSEVDTVDPEAGTSTEARGLPDLEEFFEDLRPGDTPKSSGRKGSKKNSTDSEVVVMGKVATSIGNMTEAFVASKNKISQETETPNALWCRLLAMKLNRLEEMQAECFKHEVDGMILDLLSKADDTV